MSTRVTLKSVVVEPFENYESRLSYLYSFFLRSRSVHSKMYAYRRSVRPFAFNHPIGIRTYWARWSLSFTRSLISTPGALQTWRRGRNMPNYAPKLLTKRHRMLGVQTVGLGSVLSITNLRHVSHMAQPLERSSYEPSSLPQDMLTPGALTFATEQLTSAAIVKRRRSYVLGADPLLDTLPDSLGSLPLTPAPLSRLKPLPSKGLSSVGPRAVWWSQLIASLGMALFSLGTERFAPREPLSLFWRSEPNPRPLSYELVLSAHRRALWFILSTHLTAPFNSERKRGLTSRIIFGFSAMQIGRAYGFPKRKKTSLAVRVLAARIVRRHLLVMELHRFGIRLANSIAYFKTIWSSIFEPLEEVFFNPLKDELVGDLTFVARGRRVSDQLKSFFRMQRLKYDTFYIPMAGVKGFNHYWSQMCRAYLARCVEIDGLGSYYGVRVFWAYTMESGHFTIASSASRRNAYRKPLRSVRRRITKRITKDSQRRLWVF